MKNKINSLSLMLFLIIGLVVGSLITANMNKSNYTKQDNLEPEGTQQYRDHYLPRHHPPMNIPINVPTNIGFIPQATYMQVGILSPLHDKNEHKILPLMGRPLFANRDKWQYYSMSDQNNSIRLPIIKNRKSCTDEYGCDMLSDRDHVYVEGYNQMFRVTLYQNNTMRYIPVM
jgi:hypothetical protein